jgi:hypothetical protein
MQQQMMKSAATHAIDTQNTVRSCDHVTPLPTGTPNDVEQLLIAHPNSSSLSIPGSPLFNQNTWIAK